MKTTISSNGRKMSNSGLHRSGGLSSGSSRWWLRNEDGFVDSIPYIRGDRPFCEEMDLEPGEYVLGTGKGKDSIRIKIVVE